MRYDLKLWIGHFVGGRCVPSSLKFERAAGVGAPARKDTPNVEDSGRRVDWRVDGGCGGRGPSRGLGGEVVERVEVVLPGIESRGRQEASRLPVVQVDVALAGAGDPFREP